MKKLFCILLIAVLCIAFISCADVPEVTPNETEADIPEAVTPNEQEITEPEIPEAVTQNESEITEPEIPDDVTPNEPEIAEPDENVVMLPEADENTIKYTLELPEDFIFGSYTDVYEPQNIVDFDEFDFGDNALRIEYSLPTLTSLRWFTAVAYIGNGIHSLEEGKEAYNRYWGIDEQPYYDKYNQEPPFVVEPEVEAEVIDYDIIGKDVLYDVDNFNGKPRNYNDALIIQKRYINGRYDEEKVIYTFHSPDMSRMLYEITVPRGFLEDENKTMNMDVLQIIDKKHILVEILAGEYGYVGEYIEFMSSRCTYILDLELNEWHRIQPFAFNAVVSPDGKYLAYSTTDFSGTYEAYWDDRDHIKGGYYIKEMSTGKTVYYPNLASVCAPFDWISADVLK